MNKEWFLEEYMAKPVDVVFTEHGWNTCGQHVLKNEKIRTKTY